MCAAVSVVVCYRVRERGSEMVMCAAVSVMVFTGWGRQREIVMWAAVSAIVC